MGGFCGGQCLGQLVQRQFEATQCGPCRGRVGRLLQIAGECLAHDAQSECLVGDAGKGLWNAVDDVVAIRRRAALQDGAQHRTCFTDTVQRQQDLQHKALCVWRIGQGLGPGLRSGQGCVSRACLKRHFHSTPVQLRIALLARGVQNQ